MEEVTVTPAAEAPEIAASAAESPADVFGFETVQGNDVVFDFAPEGAVAVDAPRSAEPRSEEPRPDGGVALAAPDNIQNSQKSQKGIGTAFMLEARRQRERADREYQEKLAADPIRKLGSLIVENVMNAEGKTLEEAQTIAEDRLIGAMAKQAGLTPAQMRLELRSRSMAEQQVSAPQKIGPGTVDPETRAEQIMEELLSVDMPSGFDLETATADEAFVSMLATLPAATAVRLYHAEQRATAAEQRAQRAEKAARQDVAEKIQARREIPQPMKSAPAAAAPRYSQMTSDEFWQFEQAHGGI